MKDSTQEHVIPWECDEPTNALQSIRATMFQHPCGGMSLWFLNAGFAKEMYDALKAPAVPTHVYLHKIGRVMKHHILPEDALKISETVPNLLFIESMQPDVLRKVDLALYKLFAEHLPPEIMKYQTKQSSPRGRSA